MIGETLSHYRILAKLGEGGMGEVYRAEDSSLGRQVALKVLPAEMASSEERLERFQREAETLASLDHPNIVTLYAVEDHDGVRFLTMQLVEGKRLSDLIPPQGMPLERIFEIAIPLADALAAAHDRGVVHRDLKPSNIMVSDEGRVKVLDFGLAKLRPDRDAGVETQLPTEPLTQDGLVLGTVPYMSPQQLEGKELDARSDIFSLGVLLYEMTTGSRPFQGDSSASVISAILTETPEDVDSVRGDLPHHLGRIVRHCLEKDPSNRYQSALDIRNELKDLQKETESGVSRSRAQTLGGRKPHARRRGWLLTGTAVLLLAVALVAWLLPRAREPASQPSQEAAAAAAPSIAVLPFADMSPGGDQEYFTDGLTEEVINSLARLPDLRVVGRTSSFQFKGKTEDLRAIGGQLDVSTLLEGSVRKAGNQLRITAQLVDVSNGFHLWSESYDREISDVFAVQEEIAREVAGALEIALLPVEKGVPPAHTTGDVYDLYLLGQHFENQQTEEGLKQALDYYGQALELDSEFAPALAGMATTLMMMGGRGYLPPKEIEDAARTAIDRALELDPSLAKAWLAQGWFERGHTYEFEAAEASFRRALELSPQDPQAMVEAAKSALALGRPPEDALTLYRRAVALDPLNAPVSYYWGFAAYSAWLLDEAETAYGRVLQLNPEFPRGHVRLAQVYLAQSRPAKALEMVEKEVSEPWRLYGQALVLPYLGRDEEAQRALGRYVRERQAVSAIQIATLYASRNQRDEAFHWLERAYEQGDTGIDLFNYHPLFDTLRDDPRWLPLLDKVGLPHPPQN